MLLGPSARAHVYRAALARSSVVPRDFPPGWWEETEEPRFAFRLDTGVVRRTPLDPRFLPAGWKMQLEANGEVRFVLMENNVTHVTNIDPRGLPAGWRMLIDMASSPYFCCDQVGRTTYTDPRGLPDNCELRLVGDDVLETLDCFVNHRTKSTTWHDPRDDVMIPTRQEWMRRDLADYLACRLAALVEAPLTEKDDDVITDHVPERLLAVASTLPHEVCVATHRGDRTNVQDYLNGGGDVNAKATDDSGTLLIFASSAANDVAMVDMILRAGAKVNAQDRWGCTALAAACCPLSFQPFRQKFLEQQTVQTDGGVPFSPLSLGSCSSHARTARGSSSALSRAAAASRGERKTARSRDKMAEQSAGSLPEATSQSRRAIIERLMTFNADPDMKDSMGYTPLIVATIACEHLVIRTLLSANASRDVCDDHGMTALAHATSRGHDGIARLLRNPVSKPRRFFSSYSTSAPSPSAIAAADQAAEELLQADLAESARFASMVGRGRCQKCLLRGSSGGASASGGAAAASSCPCACSQSPASAASGAAAAAPAAASASVPFWVRGLNHLGRSSPPLPSRLPSPPPPSSAREARAGDPPSNPSALGDRSVHGRSFFSATLAERAAAASSRTASPPCLRSADAAGVAARTAAGWLQVERGATEATDAAVDGMSSALSAASLYSERSCCGVPSDAVIDTTPVPTDYLCPITYELMRHPVLLADGSTYERAAIEHWLTSHVTSPVTNEPLPNLMVVPNNMARSLIRSFVDAHPTLDESREFLAHADR